MVPRVPGLRPIPRCANPAPQVTPLRGKDFVGYLFLEIAGVLAPDTTVRLPHGYQSSQLPARRIGDSTRRHGPVVRFNPDHGRQLLSLAADAGLALHWAAWDWRPGRANEFGRFLGLPALPALVFPAGSRRGSKLAHVSRAAGGVPFALLDTCFGNADVDTWHQRGALLRLVDPRAGLVEDDLSPAREWADGLRAVQFEHTDPGPVFRRFRTQAGAVFNRIGAGVDAGHRPVYRFVRDGGPAGRPGVVASWESLVHTHGPVTALGPHA